MSKSCILRSKLKALTMKPKEKENLNNNENEDEIHVHNYNTHTNVINSSQWIRLSLCTKYKLCAMLAILQPY